MVDAAIREACASVTSFISQLSSSSSILTLTKVFASPTCWPGFQNDNFFPNNKFSVWSHVMKSPTPTIVGEGCVGQKRPVPANGPAGTDLTQYGKIM